MNRIKFSIRALLNEDVKLLPGDESYAVRALDQNISFPEFEFLSKTVRAIGVTSRFTENRKDFSIDPPGQTILDVLKSAGKDVIAVGKIEDIFNRRGITEINHTKNNPDGIEATIRYLRERTFDGLLFVNLVDFDMLYGHRNDPAGYARALEAFDRRLPEIMTALMPGDILLLTADHGCDPTTPGTDHTREYIPLLAYGPKAKAGVNLGTRTTFSDVAATVAEYFGQPFSRGTSFLRDII